MASRNFRGNSPLYGDNLYGDRDMLRRYRDFARDEHRRFAAQDERARYGGLPRVDSLTEYDRFDRDLTGGDYRPGRRHATQDGYAYGSFSGVSPDGTPIDYGTPRPMDKEYRNRARGPRGYRRSDQRIYEDICEQLTEDDRINPSEVEIKVSDGEVTLTGKLRSRNAKRHATHLIESISGVKDVYNNIRVSDDQVWPPSGSAR